MVRTRTVWSSSSLLLPLLLLASGLFLAQPAACEEEIKEAAKDVATNREEKPFITELVDATFDNFLESNEYCLVLFYEPWCSNCMEFMPVFEEVAKSVKGTVSVGRIQISNNRETAAEHEIDSFPNLRIYIKDTETEYTGERTFDKIIKFIEKGSKPPYTELKTPEETAQFVSAHPLSVVACGNAKNPKFKTLFEHVSQELYLSTDVSFGWGSSASVIGTAACPALVMHRPDSETPEEFSFENGAKGVRTWIARRSIEPIEEMNAGNFDKYVTVDLPLAWIITPSEAEPSLLESLRAVALEFAGKLAFVWLSDEKYPGQTHHLGVNYRESLPTMVITTEERRYVLPRAKAGKELFTADVAREFVRDFLDGKIVPNVRSLEAPSEEENAKRDVKVAVATNFGSLARNPARDVMVNFYAPWCGHCQALAPVYEQAARMLAGVDSVVFAEMDATENDIPSDIDIVGYPTMYLFPAGQDSVPVKYIGDRSVASIMKFVQEHAAIKFEIQNDVEKFINQEEEFVAKRIAEMDKENEEAKKIVGIIEEAAEVSSEDATEGVENKEEL